MMKKGGAKMWKRASKEIPILARSCRSCPDEHTRLPRSDQSGMFVRAFSAGVARLPTWITARRSVWRLTMSIDWGSVAAD